MAVGDFTTTAFNNMTLAEKWNGTSWSIMPTPNPSGALTSFLLGVSCTSATACTAVGYYDNSTSQSPSLAEAWNGSSWSIQPTPNPSSSGVLRAVSCTSASACSAVGDDTAGNTLAEAWNGTSWSIQSTPNPTGANASVLYGLSCTAATACTAVGSSYPSTGSIITLAEVWNGSTWTLQSTPNPAATASFLAAVSCTSSTSCSAVGYQNYLASYPYVTLAEQET
jgi:hypothetical protein